MRFLLPILFLFSFQSHAHQVGIDYCVPTENHCEILTHEILGVATLGNTEKPFILKENLWVRSGGTLQIGPGVRVLSDNNSKIIVERGAKILVLGTIDKPVFMGATHDLIKTKEHKPSSSGFGGLFIYGNAPIAKEGRGAHIYKNQGNDIHDNSGIVQNLVIRDISMAFDHYSAGLLLVGVGDKTILKNLDIQRCSDDCLAVQGGSVAINSVTVDFSGDDMIDVKYDYTGQIRGVHSPTETFHDRFYSLAHFTGDYQQVIP